MNLHQTHGTDQLGRIGASFSPSSKNDEFLCTSKNKSMHCPILNILKKICIANFSVLAFICHLYSFLCEKHC